MYNVSMTNLSFRANNSVTTKSVAKTVKESIVELYQKKQELEKALKELLERERSLDNYIRKNGGKTSSADYYEQSRNACYRLDLERELEKINEELKKLHHSSLDCVLGFQPTKIR